MSEIRVVVCAVLLSVGVAAAVAAGMTRMAADERPRIASVRLAELAAEHAAQSVRADGSPGETAEATRAWALALEDALGRVAARGNVVLLPARAVAAGVPDMTGPVRLLLEERLERSAPEPGP